MSPYFTVRERGTSIHRSFFSYDIVQVGHQIKNTDNQSRDSEYGFDMKHCKRIKEHCFQDNFRHTDLKDGCNFWEQ